MYEIRHDLKSVKVPAEQIVAIIESINTPMVAAEGKPLEPTKGLIMGVRNPSGMFSIYIYLHLLQSKECLIYLHDPPEIPMEAYHETEVEALQFVESMGFMVDNLNFRKLPPEQQQALIQGLPIFYDDLEAYARMLEPEPEGGEERAQADVDLSPLQDDVIELSEVAEEVQEAEVIQEPVRVVSEEGLARIARLFSSF